MRLIIEFKNVHIRLSIIILLLFATTVSGDTPVLPPNATNISISVENGGTDSVTLIFMTDEKTYEFVSREVNLVITGTSPYILNLEFIKKPTGFYFSIKGKIAPGPIYYISPDQEMNFVVKKNGNGYFLSSTSKNAELIDLFIKIEDLWHGKGIGMETPLPPTSTLQEKSNFIGSKLSAQLTELQKYKQRMPDALFQYIENNLIAKASKGYYDILSREFNRSKKNTDTTVAIESSRQLDLLKKYEGHVFGINYLTTIVLYEKLKYRAENQSSYTINKLIKIIEDKYQGELKDKLLTYCIVEFTINNYSQFKSLVDSTIQSISSLEDVKYIEDKISKLEAGKPFFNFSLTDPSGKNVTLSDFKGKVILIDLWFTGCSGCITAASMLETEIIPNYKYRSDISFISISTDKDKHRWINSIENGLYTAPVSINLYTNGDGWNNEFIKYYNFHSAPQLMLVDKHGKIVSTKLPISAVEIRKIIDETLMN